LNLFQDGVHFHLLFPIRGGGQILLIIAYTVSFLLWLDFALTMMKIII